MEGWMTDCINGGMEMDEGKKRRTTTGIWMEGRIEG